MAGAGEAEAFQLEMSGLLSELACPYPVLTSGDVTQRLVSRTDCLLLLSTTSFIYQVEVFRATDPVRAEPEGHPEHLDTCLFVLII